MLLREKSVNTRICELTEELTGLEYERPRYLHISAIARRLYSLVCANERTYDKCSGVTETIEGAELDSHGRVG